MTDFADMAQMIEQVYRDAALSLHHARSAVCRDWSGPCLGCGDDIPSERFAAVPSATHCVACQERIERKLRE